MKLPEMLSLQRFYIFYIYILSNQYYYKKYNKIQSDLFKNIILIIHKWIITSTIHTIILQNILQNILKINIFLIKHKRLKYNLYNLHYLLSKIKNIKIYKNRNVLRTHYATTENDRHIEILIYTLYVIIRITNYENTNSTMKF